MDTAIHESLCRRCGTCCRNKVLAGSPPRVFILATACQYLNPDDHTCLVYRDRHTVRPDCLDVFAALKQGLLPGDCPYVAAYAPPDYVPPIDAVAAAHETFE